MYSALKLSMVCSTVSEIPEEGKISSYEICRCVYRTSINKFQIYSLTNQMSTNHQNILCDKFKCLYQLKKQQKWHNTIQDLEMEPKYPLILKNKTSQYTVSRGEPHLTASY